MKARVFLAALVLTTPFLFICCPDGRQTSETDQYLLDLID
jgi:hypothetical protein